ncbi:MAG: filamentous hemagglutinin N-terminal domain-containing protein, partial [Rhizobiales bacterium]|nr:filamentous hemagglutinin N-terminal domain-containing protein [Hyphomicrobiales bacterium]
MMSPRFTMRRHRLALMLTVSVLCTATASRVQAAPDTPIVQVGAATITPSVAGSGIQTDITTTDERLFIDWDSFNIGADDIVNFYQPGSQSIAVNRVVGGALTPTAIDGVLSANGHVWILDPAGIAFNAGATIDVGGLLATSANLDPTAFENLATLDDPAGFVFTDGGTATASVTNATTINSSGLIALVAPFVENTGTLASEYGDVLLGGASAFNLSFEQVGRTDGVTPFDELLVTDFIITTGVTKKADPDETVPINNTGTITGTNVIAAAASIGGGAFINMDGVVEATDAGTRSGDAVIIGGGSYEGGAATQTATASDNVRIKNADITAAGKFEVLATDISVEKGTGPGTILAGSARLVASTDDVATDAAIETTDDIYISAALGKADVARLSAGTTLEITADDIDLAGKLTGTGSVTLEATGSDISGTDIDIEGGSVTLTGAVV